MKNLKKLASLLLALVMIFTFTFTGTLVYAEDTAATLTMSRTTVDLGDNHPITITVTGGEGGLSASTVYTIRLAKSYNTPEQSGFNSGGLAGDYITATTVTTDENGGFEVTLSTHVTKVTEAGKYTYAIMEGNNGWSTKAVANFEVLADGTPNATLTMSRTSVELGDNHPITLTVTGGEFGLKANTVYTIRLAKSYNTPEQSGFNSGGLAGDYITATTVTTDENGGFEVTLSTHVTKVTEAGKYTYAIMEGNDGWSTKAVANFTVTEDVTPDATLTMSRTEVELGKDQPITITVTGGDGGLEANTQYKIRMAKSYNTPEQSGFNSGGLAGSYVGGTMVTTDENGGFEVTLNTHITSATEVGKYTYAIMAKASEDATDYWATKAVANFVVIESATPNATLTVSPSTVELAANMPITITVTGGDGGLEANTQYKIRMAKSYNTPEQSGFNGAGLAGSYVGGTMVTTDENGGFEVTLNTHVTNVTEIGKYTYAIMAKASEDATDYWSTKAVANFEVVEMGDHGHFTNETNEFYVGKSVALTYNNLDLTTYGTPEFKLYKWTEDWSFSANKTELLSGSWKQLTSTSGTVTFTATQMEAFGGEGTYVAVINGTGYTKFTEFKFTYVPNPKGMTIENTTLYRGQSVRIELSGAESGDAIAIFANGIPAPYTILGGSYRALADGQETIWTETSQLAPGEYTVGLWASGWDFNERINITIEKMDNDINYDAKVNIIDLVRLKKMSAELVDKTDDADLNSDGEVNGTDLTYLRMILLGKDPAEAVVIGDNEVVDNWDF